MIGNIKSIVSNEKNKNNIKSANILAVFSNEYSSTTSHMFAVVEYTTKKTSNSKSGKNVIVF